MFFQLKKKSWIYYSYFFMNPSNSAFPNLERVILKWRNRSHQNNYRSILLQPMTTKIIEIIAWNVKSIPEWKSILLFKPIWSQEGLRTNFELANFTNEVIDITGILIKQVGHLQTLPKHLTQLSTIFYWLHSKQLG